MDKDDLFAEFLFNKTKTKALNNLQHQVSKSVEGSLNEGFLLELQSIFVEYLSTDESVKQRPEDFLLFIRQEMPFIKSKFQKLCNGKKD